MSAISLGQIRAHSKRGRGRCGGLGLQRGAPTLLLVQPDLQPVGVARAAHRAPRLERPIGLSIALASLGDFFVEQARAAGVSMEIMHRAAAIASGGMDLLPHNGSVITLLAICGLTHRQSYLNILAISIIATLAGAAMILVQHATGTF